MLDCTEVSMDKTETVKDIVDKYEAEIRIHVKMQQEQKRMIEELELKLADVKFDKSKIVKQLSEDNTVSAA